MGIMNVGSADNKNTYVSQSGRSRHRRRCTRDDRTLIRAR